jgi:hypothetical protein
MSATTALGAAPPLAAEEETAAATPLVDRQEEQKVAKDAKADAPAVEADETTDVSEDDTVVAEEVPPSGEDLRQQAEARQAAAQRVRQSASLPPGLRERLAALVENGGQLAEGQALVSIDAAIRAIAESLPSWLQLGGGDVHRPEHPGGDSFFSGRSAEEITDQQAEEIARGQLARSGLLRGQRVRVAQD